MKPHVLFILAIGLLFSYGVKAGTGTLNVTNPTFPVAVVAGADLTLDIVYTSDVACKFNYGIFLTGAGTTDPDWGTWKAGGDVELDAGTDIAKTITIPIDGSFNSESLDEGIEYILAMKLYDDAGDFAYFNQGTILNVTAASTASNSIAFTNTPPAVLHPGDDVTVDIEYTIEPGDSLEVKVAITAYGAGYSWINGDLIVSYRGKKGPSTTTTPVQESVTITIPADATLTSGLNAGEFYTYDIGLYTAAWGYIMSTKADLAIEAGTAVSQLEKNSVSIYPNPANDMINVAGATVGQTISIYNMAGQTVINSTISSELTPVNVSELNQGIYFVSTGNQIVKFIKR